MNSDRRGFLRSAGGMAAMVALAPTAAAVSAGSPPMSRIAGGLARRLPDSGYLVETTEMGSRAFTGAFTLSIEHWHCECALRPSALKVTVAAPRANGKRLPVRLWNYQRHPVENEARANSIRLHDHGTPAALLIERTDSRQPVRSLTLPVGGEETTSIYVLTALGQPTPPRADWSTLRLRNDPGSGWTLCRSDGSAADFEYAVVRIEPDIQEVTHV